MDAINKNAIESIKVVDKAECFDLEWREKKSNFMMRLFNEEQPAAFYHRYCDYPYSVQDLENGEWLDTNLIVYGKKAYFLPYVQTTLVSGQKKFLYFKSYRKALEYARKFIIENDLSEVMIYN